VPSSEKTPANEADAALIALLLKNPEAIHVAGATDVAITTTIAPTTSAPK
jgi:hypothetical protein